MTGDANNPARASSPPAKKSRSRPTVPRDRRAEIVGAIVLEHARSDEDFRGEIASVLRLFLHLRSGFFENKSDFSAMRALALELELPPAPKAPQPSK